MKPFFTTIADGCRCSLRKVSPDLAAKLPPEFTNRKKYPLVLTGYSTELLRRPFLDITPEHRWNPTLISIKKQRRLVDDKDVFPLGYVRDVDIPPQIRNAKSINHAKLIRRKRQLPGQTSFASGHAGFMFGYPCNAGAFIQAQRKIAWFNRVIADYYGRIIPYIMSIDL